MHYIYLPSDLIDVVKDILYGADYVKDEDPKVYHSDKSGRGPLTENWLEEYWEEVRGKDMPLPNGKSIMCAYKLCKVEFRYWGMQTKIEKFIHDIGKWKKTFCHHQATLEAFDKFSNKCSSSLGVF